MPRTVLCALAGTCLAIGVAHAQAAGDLDAQREITLEQVLDLARQKSPDLAISRARKGEAGGEVLDAQIWLPNPEVEASAGPRFASDGTTTDWSVGARQRFELGGERQARIAAAVARAEAADARAENDERIVLREAARSYVRLLYWQLRTTLARDRIALAENLEVSARRRRELGSAGILDESLARIAGIRARANEAEALASFARQRTRLARRLGLAADVRLVPRESLATIALGADIDRDAPALARADVRAWRAEARAAAADGDEARAARIPDVALGAAYAREEDQDIVRAMVGIEVPLFDQGQGRAAVAAAREERLRFAERAAAESVVAEHAAARDAVVLLAEAATDTGAALEALAAKTRELAQESYAAGAVPLGDVLAVRREVNDAEIDHADLLLAAAEARIDWMAATGVWK